jgi:hypothetical protein
LATTLFPEKSTRIERIRVFDLVVIDFSHEKSGRFSVVNWFRDNCCRLGRALPLYLEFPELDIEIREPGLACFFIFISRDLSRFMYPTETTCGAICRLDSERKPLP